MKNKFFDNKPSLKIEEKVPQEVDLDMEIEEEKETVDFEMKFEEETVQEMEIDERPEESDMNVEEGEKDILEDAKIKRADRRKTILKELEVCDLLDLRNPQCVAEYATNIYDQMRLEETNFLIWKEFLDET